MSRFVDVAGLRTHYRVRPGDDPPVVLVHGLAVSHRYLMPAADALPDRYRVIVPDLSGFGLTGKPPVATTWVGTRGTWRRS